MIGVSKNSELIFMIIIVTPQAAIYYYFFFLSFLIKTSNFRVSNCEMN